MEIVEQNWKWVQKPVDVLVTIEKAGRTCYKSEDKISAGTAEEFARRILKSGHESVIEHVSASVRFVTNRGVAHELVRHRLCSFSQESTRYVRYTGDMQFIKPVWWDEWGAEAQAAWTSAMGATEQAYLALIEMGSKAQQAREVLPNSLKAEIVVTANMREWRHIFRLRCSTAAHPQMRHLMLSCLEGFQREIPVLFDNLTPR